MKTLASLRLFHIFIGVCIFTISYGQERDDSTKNKKKSIYFGLSIGYRQAFSVGDASKFLATASISPVDSTLHIQHENRYSFLISGVFSVFPFKERTKKWSKNIGFTANINIADITMSGNFNSVFNKQIEGGAGLSYLIGENFSITLNYEYIFHRRIRDYLFAYNGKKISNGSFVLTHLDEDDNDIFINDNVRAGSLKFVYYFE
jgi:hypothetical protein